MSSMEIAGEGPHEPGNEPRMEDEIRGRECPAVSMTFASRVSTLLKEQPPAISEKAEEKVRGIEITIPLGGKRWKKISLETGLKTTMEMKNRLRRIAEEENLDIAEESDADEMFTTVRLGKKDGFPYTKPISPENIAFINLFDFKTF